MTKKNANTAWLERWPQKYRNRITPIAAAQRQQLEDFFDGGANLVLYYSDAYLI